MLEATMANATKYCHVTRPHGGVPFDGPVLLNFVPYGGEYIGAGRVGNMSLSDQIHIYEHRSFSYYSYSGIRKELDTF